MDLQNLDNVLDLEYKKFFNVFLKQNSNKFNKIFLKTLARQLQNPGKKLRAKLLIASYLACSKKRLPAYLIKWAISLEILQGFILIHDDIVDESLRRRGQKTLPEELKAQGFVDSAKLALLAGDLLYVLGFTNIFADKQDPALGIKAFNYLLATGKETALGQLEELILDVSKLGKLKFVDIEKLYIKKTAEYTFAAPLVCGAILAGAKPKTIKQLELIGKNIGLAFQIQDDLLDIWPKKFNSNKSFYQDIKKSKLTWPLIYIFSKADQQEQEDILSIYSKKNKTLKEIKRIVCLFDKYQTLELAVEKITNILSRELNSLDRMKEFNGSELTEKINKLFLIIV